MKRKHYLSSDGAIQVQKNTTDLTERLSEHMTQR